MQSIKNREAIFELKLQKAELAKFIESAENSMNSMLTQAVNHTNTIKRAKLEIAGLHKHIEACEQSIQGFNHQIESIDKKINEKLNKSKSKLKKKGT